MIFNEANSYANAMCHTYYKTGYEQGKSDATKWTSIKDRLPDDDEMVIVTFVDTNTNERHGSLAFKHNDNWELCCDLGDIGTNHVDIIAWMPVPTPYEGD